MGDRVPEEQWSDWAGPPPGSEPARTGRNSRPAARGRYPAVWAAAGLLLLGGGAAGVVLLHESSGQPPAQTVFCGLVECSVLHSEAAAATVPPGSPALSPVARRRRSRPPTLALA